MTRKKTESETPKLDALQAGISAFYEATNEIKAIRDRTSTGQQELKKLADDLETPPSELKKQARAIRNEIEDSEFEIAALERRVPALAGVLGDLSKQAAYEHRSSQSVHTQLLHDTAAELASDPALVEGVRLLKVALQVSPSRHHLIDQLGLHNIADASYQDVAEESGHVYHAPVESRLIRDAQDIYNRSKKPDTMIIAAGGNKLKWYEVL